MFAPPPCHKIPRYLHNTETFNTFGTMIPICNFQPFLLLAWSMANSWAKDTIIILLGSNGVHLRWVPLCVLANHGIVTTICSVLSICDGDQTFCSLYYALITWSINKISLILPWNTFWFLDLLNYARWIVDRKWPHPVVTPTTLHVLALASLQ